MYADGRRLERSWEYNQLSNSLDDGLFHPQAQSMRRFFFESGHAAWVTNKLQTGSKSIGLDVGITSLLATSDGDKIANPRHFKRHRQKLKQVQKSLSRKKKGSNNRHKARVKVARVHGKIADSRKDFLHKLTTQLVRVLENSPYSRVPLL